MSYKRLFIWVEGNDDERFFESVIIPKIKSDYNFVKIIKYSQKSKKYKQAFISSIKAMGADYLFFSDINDSSCVTAKKEKLKSELRNIESDRIVIAIKEIESWYLAGIKSRECQKLKISPYKATDSVAKEEFNNLIPKEYDSRIHFLRDILKNYSIQTAKKKNRSFAYCVEKCKV